MDKMRRALEEEGYIVENVDYLSRTAMIECLAEEVIGPLLKNGKVSSCRTIHFVTHSLGGILVRCYFRDRDDPRLGRVVMLGPPNRGSEVVDHLKEWSVFRKLNGPAGGQLGTDSESLPNLLGPVRFELGVIAGDRTVNFINSLMIPGPDDGKVSVENTKVAGMRDHIVLHTTHPLMMNNSGVIGKTILFLKTGRF